jgi:hypothetical protein
VLDDVGRLSAPLCWRDRDVFDKIEVPSQRGKCYRGGFRNNFWPSCHAANCALICSSAASRAASTRTAATDPTLNDRLDDLVLAG